MDKKIVIGIIGGCRIARIHAENIARNIEDVEIRYVADVNPDIPAKWAAGAGVKNVVSDSEIILQDPEVQAVLVCTPTNLHCETAIRVAKAGMDIFCEKPIDLTLEKIEEALAEVKKAGVRMQVGFNRRFDHNYRRVHDAIQAGKIGKPLTIKLTVREYQAPPVSYLKESGGIFLDMAIHDFDIVRYMAGSEVESVYAMGSVSVAPEVAEAGDIDTAVTVLRFKNGVVGIVEDCRKSGYGFDDRLEVFGTKGMATTGDDTYAHVEFACDDGFEREGLMHSFDERFSSGLRDIMIDFFNNIREGKPASVSGEDGLQSMRIGFAAKQSQKENRIVEL